MQDGLMDEEQDTGEGKEIILIPHLLHWSWTGAALSSISKVSVKFVGQL